MPEKSIFLDFMYAVAVGAALPRLDETHFSFKDPVFWGTWFFIAMFLEDFFLVHTRIEPCLPVGFPDARSFIVTMFIVMTWYLGQVSFSAHRRMSLLAITAFYSFRFVAGLLMPTSPFRTTSNLAYFIMIAVTLFVSFKVDTPRFNTPGRVLRVLMPTWVVVVVLWWTVAAHLSCPSSP
jgi:hypothetical protein